MKAHVGVDANLGLTHTVVMPGANTNDVAHSHAPLHGEETHALVAPGYTDVTKREEDQASIVS